MRRITLPLMVVGLLAVGAAAARAEVPLPQPAATTVLTTTVDQPAPTPVRFYGYVGRPGYYGVYRYPPPYARYYYPAPVYPDDVYVRPGWRAYGYGYYRPYAPNGFYYSGPRRSFGIGFCPSPTSPFTPRGDDQNGETPPRRVRSEPGDFVF